MSNVKKFEYVTVAGPGQVLAYGVTDNMHTVNAYTDMALRKAAAHNVAYDTDKIKIHVSACDDDCVTGM